MGVGALVSGLFSLGAAAISAQGTKSAAAANANAQQDINEKTMNFNRVEAEKARTWQSEQGAIEREFNAEQAEIGRQFTERISNTAHQREVEDLRAAGLNPILSAGGTGSSSPVSAIASSGSIPMGATASVSGLQAPRKENVLGAFINTAMEGMRLGNDLKRAQAQVIEAQASKTRAETDKLRQAAEEKHIDQQIKTLKADEDWKNWQSQSEAKKIQLIAEQIISEKKRQTNEQQLTAARVSEAYSIGAAAVRNAEINARRQEVDAELGRAQSDRDRERLENEKKKLNFEYEQGQKNLERQWMKDHPYWSHTLYTVDKVIEAVSPVKLRFLKD